MDGKNITSRVALAPLQANARSLEKEFAWFSGVLDFRFSQYFKGDGKEGGFPAPPDLSEDPSVYARIIKHYPMTVEERLVVLLALAPHIKPWLLDVFFTKNANYDRVFTEFGGVKGFQHGGFLPTGETAAFLLAGKSTSKRLQTLSLFEPQHFFTQHGILSLEHEKPAEPLLSGSLVLSQEYLTYLGTGQSYRPAFSSLFPAQQLTTPLEIEDLVLSAETQEEIGEILTWIRKSHVIMEEWGLNNRLKAGFRSLFYGPPGTGKTLTAALLGKESGLDVYRVDLSKVVSKYIGETEKNMANIFAQAENKNWILFFDEADALFGKRTATSDAKDRYANQEVAYLLQRIEDFNGVVILASNLRSNLDEAFARRFQSIVHFPIPNPEQRQILWQQAFEGVPVSEEVDWEKIAHDYEITGGAIINILRYCSLRMLQFDRHFVLPIDVLGGIRREMAKEGKTI
jgi:hypothetical protein